MEARLLEGLLRVEIGRGEARVGGDQLEGGHAHLGGRRGLDPAAHQPQRRRLVEASADARAVRHAHEHLGRVRIRARVRVRVRARARVRVRG